jgi:ferritin-like metal-binding protein YciE
MANFESLEDLLHDELKDIYDAEKQLTKALPKLIKKASAPELKEALDAHLQETETHMERLDEAFGQLGLPAKGKKCEGMQHLIGEGEDMIGDADNESARDAVIIAAAQKCEHYEISSYGTICTWAALLGNEEVADLLRETLQEEKDADQKLTEIAEGFVNERATSPEGEEAEEERVGAVRGRRQASRRPRSAAADRKRAR